MTDMKIQSGQRVVTTGQAPVHAPAAGATAPAAPAGPGWVAKPGEVTVPAGAVQARNAEAARAFFDAFGRQDRAALREAYRPDAKFNDDMFTLTKRDSIMKMWGTAPPFASFRSEILGTSGDQVRAKWVVDYEMFGNKVHNEIESTLTFDANGKIASQDEHWDRTKWMSQALPHVPKLLHGATYAVMRPLLTRRMGG